MATAQDVLDLARSTLGTIEGPGNNETCFGAWSGANHQPWCSSWVCWVLDAAGVGIGKLPYCPTAVAKFKAMGALRSTPEAGDAFFLWFPGMGRYAHTGLVERVDGDWFVTVEGNASTTDLANRNGGMVVRNRRKWAGTKTVFGRPAYAPASGPRVDFEFQPPHVLRPIISEDYPPEGGVALYGDDGSQYAYAGAPYTGPQPGRAPTHEPYRLEPIATALRGPDGRGAWLGAASGAIYDFGVPRVGAPNEHPEFWGARLLARLKPRGDRADGFIAVSTSNETYDFPL